MKIVLLIKAIVLFTVSLGVMISCGTKRSAFTPVTFEVSTPELQGYSSLTLWRNPNTYVEYVPALSINVLGIWNVMADTLTCIPKYWYSENNGNFVCEVIDSTDTTAMSIPQVYVVLKNSIEDITDYSVIFDNDESSIEETPTSIVVNRPKLYRRQ